MTIELTLKAASNYTFFYTVRPDGKVVANYVFNDGDDSIVLNSVLEASAHAVAAAALGTDGDLSNAPFAFTHDGKDYTANTRYGPSGEVVLLIYHGGAHVTTAETGFIL